MDKVTVAIVVVFVGLLAFALFNIGTTGDIYKRECVAAKGTPVYNGHHWECLKGN